MKAMMAGMNPGGAGGCAKQQFMIAVASSWSLCTSWLSTAVHASLSLRPPCQCQLCLHLNLYLNLEHGHPDMPSPFCLPHHSTTFSQPSQAARKLPSRLWRAWRCSKPICRLPAATKPWLQPIYRKHSGCYSHTGTPALTQGGPRSCSSGAASLRCRAGPVCPGRQERGA